MPLVIQLPETKESIAIPSVKQFEEVTQSEKPYLSRIGANLDFFVYLLCQFELLSTEQFDNETVDTYIKARKMGAL